MFFYLAQREWLAGNLELSSQGERSDDVRFPLSVINNSILDVSDLSLSMRRAISENKIVLRGRLDKVLDGIRGVI